MSQIMKAFFGVFLILFMTVVSAGILSAYMIVIDAQDMHARMIDEVENSDFNPGVLKDCFSQAEENGYRLSVTLYHENDTADICLSSSSLPQDTSDVLSAKLEMTFPFTLRFFGIETEHTLCAYAR